MLVQKYRPTLTDLLKVDSLPENLGFLQGPLSSFLDKLFYENLQAFKSPNGDSVSYTLDIVTYKKLTLLEIPGTGVAFVINPPSILGVQSSSVFNVSFEYKWQILRYIRNANLQTFSFDVTGYLNLLSSVFGISKEELLEETINVFLGDINDPPAGVDPLFDLVTNYNSTHINQLTYNSGDTFGDIYSQLQAFGDNILDIIKESYLNNAFDKLKELIARWVGPLDEERLKALLIPEFSASLNNISFGIEFPRSIFTPLNSAGVDLPDPAKSMIIVNAGAFRYDTNDGFIFDKNLTFDFPKSRILGTKFTLEIDDLKIDFSKTKNIPEATADGRPNDFVGVYVKKAVIGFPLDWNHDTSPASTGEVIGTNLLIGTGGISGTIGMQAKTGITTAPIIKAKFGSGFTISLDAFFITFQQNAIIDSQIKGTMVIPGFKDQSGNPAEISIDIHIGQDGEFSVVASVEQAVPVLTIPDVFAFDVKSVFIGKKDGRFYVGCSGDIDFLVQPPLGQFLPDKIDINKLIIYDDGKFEIEGGSIYLPKAFELKLGPAKIAITAIHLGSFEKEDRKYKFFGFDGGVNVNPGGVDARGKGIKYYYTVDGPFTSGHEFKWFIRLESLSIDIMIPGGSDPAKAAVIIKGFLSIKDPKIAPGTVDPLLTILKNSTEYAGGVYVSIPKFKGLEASASMRLNPKVPAFIVDLGIEISTPILLGTTGLGIYGFRALFGKKYVASRTAADLDETAEWWQYYKAKIDPDYKEGIQTSKFLIKDGFSFGAGVSLATSSDSGKTFSSKLFFLLSLPDVFLFQGQAQFLKDRIKLDANPDPPFFAIIAITKSSIEAGFGINYKIPEDTGSLVTVDGVTELGFFFGDSSAWYFNIGRESPDSMRIQARVLNILNMYFYFMISNSGIRAGAGVSFELKKSFGPLSAELRAYIDTKGRISFRPKEIGGAIQMGGTVSLKCCGFGFSVSGGATLAAEAPKPHIITGEFEVCVKVLKKQRCAHFEFTWNFDSSLNPVRNPVLLDVIEGQAGSNLADLNKVAKSSHMVTGETLNLATTVIHDNTGTSSLGIPHPNSWINGAGPDDFRVPVDTFIDIEFKKGLNVSTTAISGSNLDRIGGISSPCQYIEFVPPQRGKSDRIRHEYFFEKIEIKYWDENSNTWEDYNFYDALIPMFPGTEQVGTLIDPTALAAMKWGYWQQQRPGYNNKLRILATTPLSYAAKSGSLPIENLGINGDSILCPGDEIPKTCVVFEKDQIYKTYPGGALNTYKGILMKITSADGIVLTVPYLGVANGLVLQPGNTIQMYFNEPMKFVNLLIRSGAPAITINYYDRTTLLDSSGVEILSGGLPVFQYNLIESKVYSSIDWASELTYTHSSRNIDYVEVISTSCYNKPEEPRKITCLKTDEQIAIRLREMHNFIATLVKNRHLTLPALQLHPLNANIYNRVYQGTGLYPNKDFKETNIDLTQGYISGTTLLFTIADNLGYSCNYSFDLLKPIPGFNFASIVSVLSVTPYTSGASIGPNYSFLLTVTANINGSVQTVEIIEKSCLPMAYCIDECSTALYRICYLPFADYLLNQTIPSDAEQDAANAALLDGINKTLQPIWRPNTTFAIRIKTSDRLYREGGSSALAGPFNLDMAYGFRTAGPIGHYHTYPVDNTPATQVVRADFNKLETADRADDFKLLSLKYYIDYAKCYPNADGDIINAKPLFYIDAELRLFYLYNYVYEFYNDWVDTNPSAMNPYVAKSSLSVLIRDPEDSGIPELNPTVGFVGGSISHIDPAGPGLPPININSINNDISTLNNILLNGSPCADYTPLAPIDISTKKTLDLKPLKIYTAQFIAKYNPLIGGQYAAVDYENVAHSYVFQTSRYSDFEEQINSYILKKNELDFIEKEAVFVIDAKKVNGILDLSLATAVITNNEIAIPDDVKLQFADQFDRLINGVMHIDYNVLHASVTTEFNIIRHPDTNAVIGILIRNPEPFNDPKLPKSNPNVSSTEPFETLEVSKWNGAAWDLPYDNYVIHSKDRTKMFVTSRDFNFSMDPTAIFKFKFRYKLYNGIGYSDVSVVDVEINLNSYSI
ncbi:MAG TPA: hypothetical protein VF868_13045 [Bacteroidia bacterium]|jgi:hypothetical protein